MSDNEKKPRTLAEQIAVVDGIWNRLGGNYLSGWTRQFDGMDKERLAEVKKLWAIDLYRVDDDAVKHALRHLPPKPPNLPEFLALCRAAPAPASASQFPALPEPHEVDPEGLRRVAQAMQGLRAAVSINHTRDTRDVTMEKLQAILDEGGKLSHAQRLYYSAVAGWKPEPAAVTADDAALLAAVKPVPLPGRLKAAEGRAAA